MSRTVVTFDGHVLTNQFAVSNLQNSLLPRNINTVDVPGRDGSLYLGATLAPRTIKLTLTVRDRTVAGLQAAARTLAAILNVDEPRPLSMSIDGGLYYMAIPNAPSDGTRFRRAIRYEVEFLAVNPVAYGAERNITVPSGGSVTFEVGGTYPTMPQVSVAAAGNGSGGFWRLRLDGGDYLIATIPDGVSTAPIDADCAARTLVVNDTVTLLKPDADWLVFEPGQHTLAMTGSGAAIVTYNERWL